MKILTVGDSFTYGEELSDITVAWPYILSKKVNGTVTNLGKPATGNTSITRNVVEKYKEYDLIVIAWSHYARCEFSDLHGTYDIWPGSNEKVHSELPFRINLVKYITQHYNDNYFYRQYLINILLLQDFLKYQNKKYVMVNAFGNESGKFSQINDLYKLIVQVDLNYFLGWPHDQMMEWTYGCPKGPNGHFLEQGHQIVADKIYEHIRDLGWVS